MTLKELSPDIRQLIDREKAAGEYASEEDVIRCALWTLAEYRETVAGVRRGLADIEAGRFIAFDDFDREFRARHGIPAELSDDDT